MRTWNLSMRKFLNLGRRWSAVFVALALFACMLVILINLPLKRSSIRDLDPSERLPGPEKYDKASSINPDGTVEH